MKTLLSKVRPFLAGKLVKQVSTSMFWQAVTRGISFFSSIWAARCLGPENLGHSGLVLATVAQVTILTTLGIEILVIREFKEGDEAARSRIVLAYSSLKVALSIFYSIVGVLVLFFFFRSSIYFWGGILGMAYFILSANNAAWLLMANEKISVNFRSSAIASVLSAVLILLWFRQPQAVFSDLAIYVLSTIVVYVITWRSLQPGILPPFRFASISEGIHMLLRGRWLFLSALLLYIYSAADQPLLGYLGSTEELGKYRTAVNLTSTIQLFFGMLPMVYYPRMIEWKKRSPDLLWKRQVQMSLGFTVIGLGMIATAWIASPFLYHVLYGERFASAATPFVILTAAKAFVLVGGPFAWGLWTNGRDLTMLTIMGVSALASTCISVLLIPRFGMPAAAFANLAGEMIIALGCIAFSLVNKRAGNLPS